MNRKLLAAISAGLAMVALFLAYALGQNWFGLAFVVVVGVMGGFGWRSKRTRLSSWLINLAFVGLVTLVVVGAIMKLNFYFLLIAMVSGLACWDIIRFDIRVEPYAASEKMGVIEQRHFILLGISLLLSAILAVVVTLMRIQINFYLALFLGICLIFAMAWLVRFMQR